MNVAHFRDQLGLVNLVNLLQSVLGVAEQVQELVWQQKRNVHWSLFENALDHSSVFRFAIQVRFVNFVPFLKNRFGYCFVHKSESFDDFLQIKGQELVLALSADKSVGS